jgi:hypothetical protein
VLGLLFNYRLTFGIITTIVSAQEGRLSQRLFFCAALPRLFPGNLPPELEQ